MQANTIAELATLIGVPAGRLQATVADYNAAATGDPGTLRRHARDGLVADARAAPPKSNWAAPSTARPFSPIR